MKLLQKAYWSLVGILLMVKAATCEKMATRKAEGASHFVELLIAIIIVIAIGLVFKNQIIAFINTIMGKATTQADALF